jgi:hypothetical protein
MRAGDASLDAWVRNLARRSPGYSGVTAFLAWAVVDLRAVVRKEVEKLLRDRAFRPNVEELAEVRLLLEGGIPPAQLSSGAAVARESIMLECWHVALSHAGHGPAALADAPNAPELAAILPAALELSALTHVWEAT